MHVTYKIKQIFLYKHTSLCTKIDISDIKFYKKDFLNYQFSNLGYLVQKMKIHRHVKRHSCLVLVFPRLTPSAYNVATKTKSGLSVLWLRSKTKEMKEMRSKKIAHHSVNSSFSGIYHFLKCILSKYVWSYTNSRYQIQFITNQFIQKILNSD